MKIKAKKTNSASENAIRSSYFVIELRKLSTSSLNVKIETCKALCSRVFAFSIEQMSLRLFMIFMNFVLLSSDYIVSLDLNVP